MKFLMVLFFLSSHLCYAEDVKKTFSANGVKSVDVENSEGRITIEGGATESIDITITKHQFPDNCKIEMKQDKDEVKVELKAPGLLKTTKCHADVTVRTPAATNLDLKAGSGDISVSKVTGDVDLKTGSGNVSVIGSPRELEAKAGSGNIDVKGLEAEADIKTGSGNIKVEYAKVPETGDLDVKTGSGDVVVSVPKGAKIKTDFMSGSGKLTNEVGDTPTSKFNVVVRSGNGGLRVKQAL